ncbi:hypothetical protein [Hansschlegelia sp.]|uniref:hypothetical protein n=1 Tax=Hansschlegelia sp. TaxID=2041892 RepID=UPI002C2639D1|nr:hypothetical protein [Hansschlegelia sp.]HVI30428.1 hypothetical protein [Hansschlegelia sp.]
MRTCIAQMLTALERDQNVARSIELAQMKRERISEQIAQKSKGRPESGVDASTRVERPALCSTAYRGEIPSSAHSSSSAGRSPAQPNQ